MWKTILICWLMLGCVIHIIANLTAITDGIYNNIPEYQLLNKLDIVNNVLILIGIVVLLL